MSILFVL